MKPAVIYARVSSKDQEKEGYSIPAQLELLRKYAQREGYQVLQEFSEAETAKQTGREQFAAMVDFLKKRKKPAALLVEKTDRLYRNLEDFVLLNTLTKDLRLEIHKVKENMVMTAESQSFEKFIDGLNVLMAKRYVDNLSEEVAKGRRQKVLQGGWPAKAPYGYKNDRNTRQIVVDPERAPFVIRAFQLYGSGVYSLEKVIDILDKEGFRYRPSIRRIGRGQLHSILSNEAYIGRVPLNGEFYPGTHTPLVDADTWRQVQAAFRKDSKPINFGKRDFLYKGLITCGECQSAIVGDIKKGKYVYYVCAGRRNGCQQGYVREEIITQAISHLFASLTFPADAKARIKDAVRKQNEEIFRIGEKEADRIETLIKKTRAKRRAIYEDKHAGILDAEMYQEIDKDCLKEIENLERQKSKITYADTDYMETADLWIELPEILAGEWVLANFEGKKKILSLACSNFFLNGENPLVELHPVFATLRKVPQNEGNYEFQDTVRTVIFPFLALHSATIRRIHQALAA